ncbi:MAG: PIN domain-containing protein [Chitinophagales bacterium]|jgi:predicted nucleic acid-binding protein
MTPRLYFDTSVFGGVFDEEFKEYSLPLFESVVLKEYILLFSSLTQEELNGAPDKVKEYFNNIEASNIEIVESSEKAIELASEYIAANVVGKTSFADCLHIALATISEADYLISWNFKHIVNVFRIEGYNSVNVKLGYKELEIRSPRDFVKYEE